MMLIFAFTLCLAFSWADYSNNHGQFRPIIRPLPEPVRPILRTTTEQPNNPTIPEMAVVDKEKVQEFFDRFCKFFDAKDLDSLLNLYADDLVFIHSGKDAAGKEAFREHILDGFYTENSPCNDRVSLISGDYYYPYYWGQSFVSSGYGRDEVSQIFSEVLYLKEDGDYEIVLSNLFDMENHNQPQDQPTGYGGAVQQPTGYGGAVQQPTGYGGAVQQPTGYGGAVQQPTGYGQQQIQRKEQPKQKISRPIPHFIPRYQRPQQNGYGQAPQQTNGYGQAQQQTNGYGQSY